LTGAATLRHRYEVGGPERDVETVNSKARAAFEPIAEPLSSIVTQLEDGVEPRPFDAE
jgi:hypothetical protein